MWINEYKTPYREKKNLPLNRHLLATSRMLCSECSALRGVVDFFSGSKIVALQCGHRRGLGMEEKR